MQKFHLLDKSANNFEEIVKIICDYLEVEYPKIIKPKQTVEKKTFPVGPKKYTKDRFYVDKYCFIELNKKKLVLSMHGNQVIIQVFYYINRLRADSSWAMGLFKNKYKFDNSRSILNWIFESHDFDLFSVLKL